MVVTGKGPTNKSAAKTVVVEPQVKGPIGVLSSKLPLPKESDKKLLIQESKNAFYNRRRIQIAGIPPGTPEKVQSSIRAVFICISRNHQSTYQPKLSVFVNFVATWQLSHEYGGSLVSSYWVGQTYCLRQDNPAFVSSHRHSIIAIFDKSRPLAAFRRFCTTFLYFSSSLDMFLWWIVSVCKILKLLSIWIFSKGHRTAHFNAENIFCSLISVLGYCTPLTL